MQTGAPVMQLPRAARCVGLPPKRRACRPLALHSRSSNPQDSSNPGSAAGQPRNGSSNRPQAQPEGRLSKLLRITALHSSKKQESIPTWFTKTQDPDDLPRPLSPAKRGGSFTSNSAWLTDDRNEWHLSWSDGSSDSSKEFERKFRRAVFSFDRWAAHRSTGRYLRHLRGILSSRTFKGLLLPLQFVAAVSTLACLYQGPGVAMYNLPTIHIGEAPLDVTAFALSLLLVFRTDSSYARWEEALRTWNEVRSLSKDVARQAIYWVNEPARKAMLVRWTIAFSRVLLAHVRVDIKLEEQLQGLLLKEEVEAVAAVGPAGAPSFVLQVISELVEQCRVSEIKEDKMFGSLRGLGDSVAVCEKLLRYPIPLAYTRHTSRFMGLWLMAMPFAFWETCGWATVPLTLVIAYLLLGIDEIGVQIEEPFGILPIEDVCADIEAEIDAMIERQDIVTELLVAGGVACPPRSTCGACGAPLPPEDAAESAAAAGSAALGRSPALSAIEDESPVLVSRHSHQGSRVDGSCSNGSSGIGRARALGLNLDAGRPIVRGYDDRGAAVLSGSMGPSPAESMASRDDIA